MAVSLWNRSFMTVAELAAALHLSGTLSNDQTDALTRALNWSAGAMERYCCCILKARNFRPVQTVTGTVVHATNTLTLDSAATTLEPGDPVMGAGLAVGSEVVSYAHPTVVLSATTANIAVSQSFEIGTGALVVDGDATSVIRLPQRPLVEVFGVASLLSDGTEEALDLTGMRTTPATARIVLPAVIVPRGDANIAISCRCGYEEPSATSIKHLTEWQELQAAQVIVARSYYQDWIDQLGNTNSMSMGAASLGVSDDSLHPAARAILDAYTRASW